MKKALIGGSLVLDVTMALEREDACAAGDLIREGKTTYLSDVRIYLGGCVGNTGVAMHRLGVPVAFCTKLADDAVGRTASGILADYGIDGEVTLLRGEETSCGIAMTPPGMDKISFFRRGASQSFTSRDVSLESLARADLFHFGYPSSMRTMYEDGGRELWSLMKKAKEAGATTSMDMSMPDLQSPAGQVDWLSILARVLPFVDLYVPSVEETLLMVDRARYLALAERAGGRNVIDMIEPDLVLEAAEKLVRMGAKAVLLKSGSRGMYLRTAGREAFSSFGRALPADADRWTDLSVWKPARAVGRVVSTTGAGDTAIAGFLSALLRDEAPETALQMAALCAASCIGSLDTVGGIRSFDRMKKELDRPHEWLPAVSADKWRWSAARECFYEVGAPSGG